MARESCGKLQEMILLILSYLHFLASLCPPQPSHYSSGQAHMLGTLVLSHSHFTPSNSSNHGNTAWPLDMTVSVHPVVQMPLHKGIKSISEMDACIVFSSLKQYHSSAQPCEPSPASWMQSKCPHLFKFHFTMWLFYFMGFLFESRRETLKLVGFYLFPFFLFPKHFMIDLSSMSLMFTLGQKYVSVAGG